MIKFLLFQGPLALAFLGVAAVVGGWMGVIFTAVILVAAFGDSNIGVS
jgi:hypothetical protein